MFYTKSKVKVYNHSQKKSNVNYQLPIKKKKIK